MALTRPNQAFARIYLAITLISLLNTFTLATPVPETRSTSHSACDDVPCIAGCLSDSWATQPSSCSNGKDKSAECLCATVKSVVHKMAFAECFMSCGAEENQKLREYCAQGGNHDEGKQDKKHGVASHKPNRFTGHSSVASVDDSFSVDDFDDTLIEDDVIEDDLDIDETNFDVDITDDDTNIEDDTIDEENLDITDETDDTTDETDETDDSTWDDIDDDDDKPTTKTPGVVTSDSDDDEEDFDEDDGQVVINGNGQKKKKGDASLNVVSKKWTTLGAVAVAAWVMMI